jgi:glutathione synthase
MKKKFFVTVADPLEHFDPQAETTSFFLAELTRLGLESFILEPKDLYLSGALVRGRARAIKTYAGERFMHDVGAVFDICLNDAACVFLRKDPPVDQRYTEHLGLLASLEGDSGPLLVNRPSGIMQAGEKILPLRFPGMSPDTVVSSRKDVLLEFLESHPRSVLKPLNEAGGRGILIVSKDDPNKMSMLEISTAQWTRHVALQAFVPEAAAGDKRILLWKGDPLGAFLRVPSGEDFRGNMHSGAKWVQSSPTNDELKSIATLKPFLLAHGLLFVGIDLIGSRVTEINVTSPMGIREINHLEGVQVEKTILQEVLALQGV